MIQDTTNNIVSKLTTRDLDMKQRRVVNAAPSKANDDYVTKGELDKAISAIDTPQVSNWPTIQKDQTSNRIFGTVYKNNGNTSRFVSVTIDINLNNAQYDAQFFCDGKTNPTILVARVTFNLTTSVIIITTISFIVLPGYYYKATKSGNPTILNWIEWS